MAVRVALGDNAFAAAWQEGRTMSSDEAMAVAISAGLGGERG
jgi:hypothetical protein